MVLRIEIAQGDRQQAVAADEVVAEERLAERFAVVDRARRNRRHVDPLAHRRDVDFGRALLATGGQEHPAQSRIVDQQPVIAEPEFGVGDADQVVVGGVDGGSEECRSETELIGCQCSR